MIAESINQNVAPINSLMSIDVSGRGDVDCGSKRLRDESDNPSSTNRVNRNRLPPVKDGESYPCGCGICDKQYVNIGNITLCHGCRNMYINKSCNREWRCMSCKKNV